MYYADEFEKYFINEWVLCVEKKCNKKLNSNSILILKLNQ